MFLDENRYERKSTWGPDGQWVVGRRPSVFEAGDSFSKKLSPASKTFFEKNMVNFFLIFEAGGHFSKKYGQFFFNF